MYTTLPPTWNISSFWEVFILHHTVSNVFGSSHFSTKDPLRAAGPMATWHHCKHWCMSCKRWYPQPRATDAHTTIESIQLIGDWLMLQNKWGEVTYSMTKRVHTSDLIQLYIQYVTKAIVNINTNIIKYRYTHIYIHHVMLHYIALHIYIHTQHSTNHPAPIPTSPLQATLCPPRYHFSHLPQQLKAMAPARCTSQGA